MAENNRPTDERDFKGIPRARWLQLARHVAEIQRYQRARNLEDKGDPPEDESPEPERPNRAED